jgi:hypothetical protein
MLPRAALMPPCAATVCERVGNSLVMHLRSKRKGGERGERPQIHTLKKRKKIFL